MLAYWADSARLKILRHKLLAAENTFGRLYRRHLFARLAGFAVARPRTNRNAFPTGQAQPRVLWEIVQQIFIDGVSETIPEGGLLSDVMFLEESADKYVGYVLDAPVLECLLSQFLHPEPVLVIIVVQTQTGRGSHRRGRFAKLTDEFLFLLAIWDVFIIHQHRVVEVTQGRCVELELVDLDRIIQAIHDAGPTRRHLRLLLALSKLEEVGDLAFRCGEDSFFPLRRSFWPVQRFCVIYREIVEHT